VLKPKIERILNYLSRAEDRESDAWMRDDYRIAWITVLYATRGYREPSVLATYRVLGVHPDKLVAAIEARRRALLGHLYDRQFLKLPPKKPAVSERERGESCSKNKAGRASGTDRSRSGWKTTGFAPMPSPMKSASTCRPSIAGFAGTPFPPVPRLY